MAMGLGVRILKLTHGGVSVSRLYASAKNGKTTASGRGSQSSSVKIWIVRWD
jgi:hypothetical protein